MYTRSRAKEVKQAVEQTSNAEKISVESDKLIGIGRQVILSPDQSELGDTSQYSDFTELDSVETAELANKRRDIIFSQKDLKRDYELKQRLINTGATYRGWRCTPTNPQLIHDSFKRLSEKFSGDIQVLVLAFCLLSMPEVRVLVDMSFAPLTNALGPWGNILCICAVAKAYGILARYQVNRAFDQEFSYSGCGVSPPTAYRYKWLTLSYPQWFWCESPFQFRWYTDNFRRP